MSTPRADIRVAGVSNFIFNNTVPGDLIFKIHDSNTSVLFGYASAASNPLVSINNTQVAFGGKNSNVSFSNGVIRADSFVTASGTPIGGSGQFSNTSSNVFLLGSNLGLLTSTPAYPLDVAGDINLTGTLRKNGSPYVGSQFSNTSSTVFLVGSNLGLGKSNAAYPLDVVGDINLTGILRQNGSPYVGSQFSNTNSNVFLLSSNLGIGTSTPTAALDVSGSANITGNLTVGGDLTVNGTTTTIDTQTLLIEDNIITLNKNQTGTPASFLQSGVEVERGDASNYFFVFDEATDLFKVGLSNSLQAVATRDDALQTGYPYYDSAQAKLTTRAITPTDVTNLGWQYNNSNVYLTSSNLGIGTSNPSSTLHVSGTTTLQGSVQIPNTLALASLQINKRVAGATNISVQPQLGTNGSSMFVPSGSNFGVGTSTPSTTLDVNGAIAISGVTRVTADGVLQNVTTDASNITTGVLSLARGGTGTSNATGTTGTGNIVLSANPTFTGTINVSTMSTAQTTQSNTFAFPYFGFTSNTCTVSYGPLPGTYIALSSPDNTNAYTVFDKQATTDNTATVNTLYSNSNYVGSTFTTVGSSNYYGEYWQLQTPSSVIIKSYVIRAVSASWYRSPCVFSLVGSTNGSTWSLIDTQTNIFWTTEQFRTFSVPSNTTAYSYYRIIVNKTAGDSWVAMNEMYFNALSTTTVSPTFNNTLLTSTAVVNASVYTLKMYGKPRIFNSSGTDVTANTFVTYTYGYYAFPYASHQNFDPATYIVNGSRIKVPVNGLYYIAAVAFFNGGTNGDTYMFISKNAGNDTDLVANDDRLLSRCSFLYANTTPITSTVYLTTSDYINFGFRTTTNPGGNLTAANLVSATDMSITITCIQRTA